MTLQHRMYQWLVVIPAALLAAIGTPALMAQSLTPDEIILRMKPAGDDPEFLEKGSEVNPDAPVAVPRPVQLPRPTPAAPAAPGLPPPNRSGDFNEITFEFGSARLTPSAAALMVHLATAMNRPELAYAQITIIGHTDAVGSDESNMRLSQRRADTVVMELLRRGIDSRRLASRGMGKRALLYPDRPTDPGNRRVQITATRA